MNDRFIISDNGIGNFVQSEHLISNKGESYLLSFTISNLVEFFKIILYFLGINN